LWRRPLSDNQLKWLFVLPTLALLVVFVARPLVWSLYLSFREYSAMVGAESHYVGAGNYRELLSSTYVWSHFTTTAEFVVGAVALQFVIGFGLALLLQNRFRGRGLVSTLMLTPMMLCPAVVGLFWKFMLDPNWGILGYYLSLLHLPRVAWLSHGNTALAALIVVDTWMWSPFIMLISLAGLSAVPQSLYEAAEVDRASGWFKFRHVTLPLVWPLLIIALLFRTMDAFKLFDLVYSLTGGQPGTSTATVSLLLYRDAFEHFATGRSCALAYVLLVIIIGLSNIYVRRLAKAAGQ
jgi:multiple sugar transport system permease protein